MKLASYVLGGKARIGVLGDDGSIVEIAGGLTMRDLIRMGSNAANFLDEAVNAGDHTRKTDGSEIEWLPPIPDPGKILGVAMNNSASNERKISAPDHPAFFLKPPSCLVAHCQPIRVRSYYGSVHPEPELAVIIGSTTKDVDAADALANVFGYSIMNDITGNGMRAEDLFHYWALYRDEETGELQRREQHLSYAARYKGSDTFGCMGPTIVTTDDIPDPDDLRVECRVSGEVVAEDSTRYYNFRIAELVSYISQFMTLDPGDIISCGTAFKPSAEHRSIHQANFQVVPGPVEVSIEGLGTLENPVEIEDRPMGNWRLPNR